MANYNREILVPYLRDVCSVEMLCQRFEKDRSFCQERINECNQKMNRKKYEITERSFLYFLPTGEELGGFLLFIGFGLVCFLLDFLIDGRISWLGAVFDFFLVGAGVFAIVFMTVAEMKEAEQGAAEMKQYNLTVDRERKVYEEKLQKYQRAMSYIQRKMVEVKSLRQQIYGVNIIPSRYRNIYVSYYLYDYFNSSRETDLDKVIQTLLLDEIKQRLDRIIVQNEEMLLNQRYQMAMQEKQNTMIASNHREQMKRIARMEQNQEMQLDYQNMITQNQNVTNFFLEMDFLRKKF